jgi:hypothetical protein
LAGERFRFLSADTYLGFHALMPSWFSDFMA